MSRVQKYGLIVELSEIKNSLLYKYTNLVKENDVLLLRCVED